jgi:hypothetical protein
MIKTEHPIGFCKIYETRQTKFNLRHKPGAQSPIHCDVSGRHKATIAHALRPLGDEKEPAVLQRLCGSK